MRHLRQICCLPAAIMLMSGTVHAEEAQLLSLTALMAPPMSGLKAPLRGFDFGPRRG